VDFKSVTVTRSYEQIVEQIQAGIRTGSLARGQRLPTERELGERFGVSRGVVREAVKVLAAMGLVESRQGSGIYVRRDPMPIISRALTLSVTPDESSVEQLFEFRQALEAFAAERAAVCRTEAQAATIRRIAALAGAAVDDIDAWDEVDDQFHEAIGDASGNDYVKAVLMAIRHMQSDITRLVARRIPGAVAIAAQQHARIAEAIAMADAKAAAEAMATHVTYSATALRDILEAEPASVLNEDARKEEARTFSL
jgi:GntR family transcriptional regulator, transcriptional repressor for pyruvate dehydrogenase complex